MTLDVWLAFCMASVALAIVPGPTVTVIIANSLRYGARAGLMNVAGTQAGAVIWLAIAALGLQALIAVMGVWFDALRYAGRLTLSGWGSNCCGPRAIWRWPQIGRGPRAAFSCKDLW